jgi:NitT/TauT family transport system permease protein
MWEWARKELWPALSFVAVLAGWQAIVWALAPPPFLLPSPGRVLTRLIEFGPNWPRHIVATIQAIVLGFLVAVVFGVVGALAVVASDRLRRALTPLLVTLQIVPKIAFAPLFLVWFGLGIVSKVTVAFLIAFFPVLINTAVGFVQIEPELIDLTRAIKARRSWVFLRVRLPNSLPYFFAGLRVASTLAVIGAVIAEFVGSDVGLGYLIVVANNQLDTPLALASIALVSALGLVLYGALVALERVVTPWARVPDGLQVAL